LQSSHSAVQFGHLSLATLHAFCVNITNTSSAVVRMSPSIWLPEGCRASVSCRAGPCLVAPGLAMSATVMVSSATVSSLNGLLVLRAQGKNLNSQVSLPINAVFRDDCQQPSVLPDTDESPLPSRPASREILKQELTGAKIDKARGNIGNLKVLSAQSNCIRSTLRHAATSLLPNRDMHHLNLQPTVRRAHHPAVSGAKFWEATFIRAASSPYAATIQPAEA
jgi:hypothetical protein